MHALCIEPISAISVLVMCQCDTHICNSVHHWFQSQKSFGIFSLSTTTTKMPIAQSLYYNRKENSSNAAINKKKISSAKHQIFYTVADKQNTIFNTVKKVPNYYSHPSELNWSVHTVHSSSNDFVLDAFYDVSHFKSNLMPFYLLIVRGFSCEMVCSFFVRFTLLFPGFNIHT